MNITAIKLIALFSTILNAGFIIYFINEKYGKRISEKFFEKSKSDLQVNIVMLGDSLTQTGNWTKLIDRNDVKNEGKGGFTTSHFVWLIKSSVLDFKPKICFIEGGINDLGVGVPLVRIIKNIETIVDALKANNIIPVMSLTTYTSNDSEKNRMIDELNILLAETAQQKNVEYFNLNDVLSENGALKPQYTTDGIHLSEKAYLFWAEKVKMVLSNKKI